MGDDEIVSMENLDTYLEAEFIPYVKDIYAVSVKVTTSLEEVFGMIMAAVEKLQLTKNDVSFLATLRSVKWMQARNVCTVCRMTPLILFLLHTSRVI